MPKTLLPPRHDWCGDHHDPGTCPAFGPEAQQLHDLAAQALTAQNYVLAGLLARTLDDLGYQLRRIAARRVTRANVNAQGEIARAIRSIASRTPGDDAARAAAAADRSWRYCENRADYDSADDHRNCPDHAPIEPPSAGGLAVGGIIRNPAPASEPEPTEQVLPQPGPDGEQAIRLGPWFGRH